jgi:hypothetical protein
MQGLFKTAEGVGNLELRETPRPEPGEGRVLMNPPVIIGHE